MTTVLIDLSGTQPNAYRVVFYFYDGETVGPAHRVDLVDAIGQIDLTPSTSGLDCWRVMVLALGQDAETWHVSVPNTTSASLLALAHVDPETLQEDDQAPASWYVALDEAIAGVSAGAVPDGSITVDKLAGDVIELIGEGGSGGTGAVDSVNGEVGTVVLDYADVGAAAASHGHAQSDITGLSTSLAAKANASHTHSQGDVTGLTASLAGKAAVDHTHPQSDVTGLETALAGKAAAVHTHAESDVTGLTSALADRMVLAGDASADGATFWGIWAPGSAPTPPNDGRIHWGFELDS